MRESELAMNLTLNEKGVLDEGVHDATLEEVRELFGKFQSSDRRCNLYNSLEKYVGELRRAKIKGWLIVDGSFVMSCVDNPEDVDLILVFADNWDMTSELRPYQYNLVSKRDVKREYPFDLLAAQAGTMAAKEWIDFFLQINVKWYEPHGFDNGATKGVLRITL